MTICIYYQIKINKDNFHLLPSLVFSAFRDTSVWGAKNQFWGKERVANGPLTGGVLQTSSSEVAQLGFALSSKACTLIYVNFIRLCLQGDFQSPVDLVKNLGVQHLQKHCCFNRHLQTDLGI